MNSSATQRDMNAEQDTALEIFQQALNVLASGQTTGALQLLEAAKTRILGREARGLTLMTLPAELRLQILELVFHDNIRHCRDKYDWVLRMAKHNSPGGGLPYWAFFPIWPDRTGLAMVCRQMRVDYLAAFKTLVTVELVLNGQWYKVRPDVIDMRNRPMIHPYKYCMYTTLVGARSRAEDLMRRASEDLDSWRHPGTTVGLVSFPQFGPERYICSWNRKESPNLPALIQE